MTLRTTGPALGLLALLAGCGSLPAHTCENPQQGEIPTDGSVPTGTPGSRPTDPGAEIPTEPGGGTPTDSATEPEPTTPAPVPVRFLVLGDGGRGNTEQYEVAAAMEQVCATLGCDFAVYTGDVIYDSGVDGIDDQQFIDKFEAPYANLNFPFYISVGNHDHGGDVDAQVEYTDHSKKWTMPDKYYSFVIENATFFAMDTDPIEEGDAQQQWLDAEIPAATTTWKFAFGHHPYISNGDHGDTGGGLGAVVEQSLCGKVDVYFAGHDHDLQWLQATCGTEFIVSGAASSLRDVGGDNPTNFETSTLGFMWVELIDRSFTGVFYDSDGNELYRKTITK